MTGQRNSIIARSRGLCGLALAASFSGCIFVPPSDAPPGTQAGVPAEPAAGVPLASAAAPGPSSPSNSSSAADARPPTVLVLLSRSADESFGPALAALQAELAAHGATVELATLATILASPPASARHATIAVAIGSDAARASLELLGLTTVYSQVADPDFAADGAYGVATVPPLGLQLAAFKQIDPALRSVALILSADETALAAEAERAAAAHGISLQLRTATSDQEALYVFKRLAADVDGLWLLPDNAVLSPRVLREMLDHAAAHGVGTLAFTPSLLEWGALASVTGTPADLARALAGVVMRLTRGGAAAVPAMTPLTELEVRVNVEAAARLGLPPPARHVWLVEGPPP